MPPKFAAAMAVIGHEASEVFLQHLRGGTSANYLSEWLSRAGSPVGPTTIKEARKHLAQLER